MIGCSETLERIDRALMTGEAFVRLYDEYRFPVATADEQVETQKCKRSKNVRHRKNGRQPYSRKCLRHLGGVGQMTYTL